MTQADVLRTLKALKPEFTTRFKVKELSLFGSFVRGEQTEASDVDVLVEFDESASLFDLVRLSLFLEDQLHRKIDVVPKDSLRMEFRENILRERVTV
jgi:hypothetical protein